MSLFGKRISDMVLSMAGVDEDSDSDLSTNATPQAAPSAPLQQRNPFLKNKNNVSGTNDLNVGIGRVSSFESDSILWRVTN